MVQCALGRAKTSHDVGAGFGRLGCGVGWGCGRLVGCVDVGGVKNSVLPDFGDVGLMGCCGGVLISRFKV